MAPSPPPQKKEKKNIVIQEMIENVQNTWLKASSCQLHHPKQNCRLVQVKCIIEQ